MQNDPLVSVIIPVYKVEKYLRQCVDSVIGQTYRNLEIILIDDGSPDCCGVICDEYARMDPRIRVIHQKNGGLSAARNAGLNCAAGDYMFFLDSDDWIALDTIQKMLDRYTETSADLVICNLLPYYEPDYSGPRKEDSPLKEGILTQAELLSRLMQNAAWYYCVACNKLYPRTLLDGIRFPVDFIHEDEAIAHRVFERCQSISILSEPLYFYRQVNGSIMSSDFSVKNTDALTALADRLSCARKNCWNDYEAYLVPYYTWKFWQWYHLFHGQDGADKYIKRMEHSLKKALPSILRRNQVSISHKIYLTLLRCSPKLFWTVYRSIRSLKS